MNRDREHFLLSLIQFTPKLTEVSTTKFQYNVVILSFNNLQNILNSMMTDYCPQFNLKNVLQILTLFYNFNSSFTLKLKI